MADIYRYDNLTNTAGIYQDPIGGYRLSINGNVKVKGDLCFYKEGTTDSYCLQGGSIGVVTYEAKNQRKNLLRI